MSERLFFDCNAAYGPKPKKYLEERWTLEHLLADLDLAGVAGALVSHRLARHYDPMLGNLQLVADLRPHRARLFPCWQALPSCSGEFPSVPEFLRLCQLHGVRAVRIEPDAFGIPADERAWGELRDGLQAAGLLVVLPWGGTGGELDRFEAVLRLFAGCNCVLTDTHWQNWRRVMYWLATYPRLHLEFSRFQANRGIEYVAERFGPARALFGTGLPERSPGAGRGMLDWSLLEPGMVDQIAGGNLRRLLGGRGPEAPPPATEWDDALTAAARAGQPLPALVLDDHCHMLHEGGHTGGGSLVMLNGGPDGMIELTRRMGVRQTAIMSWAGPLDMATALGNEIVAAAVAKYPGEFLGLPTVNPEYDDLAAIAAIIQRYHVELGFPGLKTLCSSQNLNYDHPAFAEWFRFANEHHLYLVFDPNGATDDGPVERLATAYPNMELHIDHCGQSWPYARWAAKMLQRWPNTRAQMNFTNVTHGTIEYLVREGGADRVLFGTDAPMRDPRPQLDWAVHTRLREADKRRVLGENFARTLRQVRLPNYHCAV